MPIEQLEFQDVEFQKYAELEFTSHTFDADDTFEDAAEFENVKDDWILLIRANGASVTARFVWAVEMEDEHTKDVVIQDGEIYQWGPQGVRFGSKITVQAKIATASGNSADFTLMRVGWFRGTGVGV